MNVEQLSKIIKELIITHDELSLPSLGVFVVEMVPAYFSDKGYTINPPYRRLSFFQRPSRDRLIAEAYAAQNGVDVDEAEAFITEFLTEMRRVLEERKTVILPGLGRLRATKENAIFFVPEEDLDIFPEGFGLGSVSLKHITSDNEELDLSLSFADSRRQTDAAGEGIPDAEDSPAPEDTPAGEMPAEEETPVADDAASEETPEDVTPEESPADETTPEDVQAEELSVEEEVSAEEVPEEAKASDGVDMDDEAAASEAGQAEAEVDATAASEAEVETADAVEATETETAEPEAEAEAEPEAEPEAASDAEAEATTEAPQADEATERRARPLRAVLITLGIIVAVAAVALAAFLILANVAPDFIDSLLYTPEELRIINY